jgi:hypothetical protein
MKRTRRLRHVAQGVCAAALLLAAFSPAMAKDPEPPRNGCAAITKAEYDSAKKQNLLRARFGNYVRTGRPLRRAYWYCT